MLITDREFSTIIEAGPGARARSSPLVIDYDDPEFTGAGRAPRHARLRGVRRVAATPAYDAAAPGDEWDAISLNYTSGTTGNPKGVVYHHRGAYLLAQGNVLTCGMGKHPVYLWTLPMFHCNGWCFPWSISVVAGTHVCLRQVRAPAMYDAIADHKVTHLCGAPIVMSTLLNAPEDEKRPLPHVVEFFTAAAPPPEAVLGGDEGGRLQRHPPLRPDRDLRPGRGQRLARASGTRWTGGEQAAMKARQGVRYLRARGARRHRSRDHGARAAPTARRWAR